MSFSFLGLNPVSPVFKPISYPLVIQLLTLKYLSIHSLFIFLTFSANRGGLGFFCCCCCSSSLGFQVPLSSFINLQPVDLYALICYFNIEVITSSPIFRCLILWVPRIIILLEVSQNWKKKFFILFNLIMLRIFRIVLYDFFVYENSVSLNSSIDALYCD